MIAVYLIIILFATLAGATCGMGGGVIIKPLLDAISSYTTFQINLVSSICVLAMALSSIVKHCIGKTKCLWKTAVCASMGSLIGGICGEFIFDAVRHQATAAFGKSADYQIKIIQNSVLASLLVCVLIFMLVKKPKNVYEQSNKRVIAVFVCSCVLGIISTFLGIGGGPINVCVLCIAMKSNMKEVTLYSLLTIFWAQVAKHIKLVVTGGFTNNVVFDASLTWWIMLVIAAVAVIGGIVGAIVNKKFPVKVVSCVYYAVIVLVIILNVYNIVINGIGLSKL